MLVLEFFMKMILFSAALLAAFALTGFAQHKHEYAKITEKEIDYRNWTYPAAQKNENIDLREFTKGKKLVMVFYFAPWCHASNFQAPVTQKLYQKYKDDGFAVIGVSLYGNTEKVRETIERKNIGFPVVIESVSLADRKKSLHYKYRWGTGDYRRWGTPWNIFLIPAELDPTGDVLTKKAFVVNGEIIEREAESFIREALGLSSAEVANY